jgi:hypothetical protein
MIDRKGSRSRGLQIVAVVAIVFGLVTLWAGGTVLAGRDPGYVVYRPLLLFNTVMGLAYVAAGVLAWRRPIDGRNAAAVILVLNVLVLARVIYLYRIGAAVAVDSVRAMSFRSAAWLMLLLALGWMSRSSAMETS